MADKWKEQLVAVQSSVRESQIRADTAESQLALAEASWNNQKVVLDKEMSDLTKR